MTAKELKLALALPIGVFDSGLGGLTVVRQLRRVMPHEDLVYLGDTARLPYGTKSPETVAQFAREALTWLTEVPVKSVVVACNTATAWALPLLQREFPLPIFGVVLPGAQAAARQTRNHRIGVIATPATIRSQAYTRVLKQMNPRYRVIAQACPLLVPLVEEGWENHPVTEQVLREYLSPLKRKGIDTLVLGCTHYPLLKRALLRVVGKDVTLIDSAESCAHDVRQGLERLGLLVSRKRVGRFRAFLTDETSRFSQAARQILRLPSAQAKRITLQS